MRAFVDRSGDRLAARREAAQAGDLDVLKTAAHELRGASGTIGADRVAGLCRELELALRPGGEAPRVELLDELDVEVAAATAELSRFVAAYS